MDRRGPGWLWSALDALLPCGCAGCGQSAPGDRALCAHCEAQLNAIAADAWRAYGDAISVYGGGQRWTEVIDAYRHAAQLASSDGPTQFRLGSALRKRNEKLRGVSAQLVQVACHQDPRATRMCYLRQWRPVARRIEVHRSCSVTNPWASIAAAASAAS